MAPIMHRSLFLTYDFVLTDMLNLKTTGCVWTFYISKSCSTIGDLYFCARTACKTHLASYGSKHVLQFFYTTFVRTSMHNMKLQVIYGRCTCQMTAALSKTFCIWSRVVWEIWLVVSYGHRPASRLFSDTLFFHMDNASPYMHHYLVCNNAWG